MPVLPTVLIILQGESSKSSRVFIGTEKVKLAVFMNDLIDPNRTVSDIIKSNENMRHFEKIEKLTLKADKCKSLYIKYRKQQCIELDINGETAENIDAVKDLGDTVIRLIEDASLIEDAPQLQA